MPAPMPATPLSPTGDSGGPASGPLPSAGDSAGGARAGRLHVAGIDREGLDLSIAALAKTLHASDDALALALEAFPGFFVRGLGDRPQVGLDGGDSLFRLGGRIPTLRTGEVTVYFEPTERYRILVTAIARRLQLEIVEIHGWPVLSVAGGTSTVSEAAGESIPGGGAAKSPDAGGVLANIAVDAIRRQTRRGL